MNNPEMIPQEIPKSSLTYKEVWETLSKVDVSPYVKKDKEDLVII